jgi:hypothetical protein
MQKFKSVKGTVLENGVVTVDVFLFNEETR